MHKLNGVEIALRYGYVSAFLRADQNKEQLQLWNLGHGLWAPWVYIY